MTLGLAAAVLVGSSHPAPLLRAGSTDALVAAPTGAGRVAAAPASARRAGVVSVSPVWVAQTARAAGIPPAAVRAYGAATLREQRAAPGCHLAWTTLAGVGWVESHHGTLGGATLGSDGRSTSRLDGPVLDGTVYDAAQTYATRT